MVGWICGKGSLIFESGVELWVMHSESGDDDDDDNDELVRER